MLYTLVDQTRGEGHEEGARPDVASCGSDGSAHLLQEVAPSDEEGRTRRPGTSSSSAAGSRVLKLDVHVEEDDSVSEEGDGEVSDGNGSDAAIEDDGPIELLNYLLL